MRSEWRSRSSTEKLEKSQNLLLVAVLIVLDEKADDSTVMRAVLKLGKCERTNQGVFVILQGIERAAAHFRSRRVDRNRSAVRQGRGQLG